MLPLVWTFAAVGAAYHTSVPERLLPVRAPSAVLAIAVGKYSSVNSTALDDARI